MIRNKLALIRSAMLFVVCMFLFFPFPNNPLLTAGSSFMSFPIRYAKGVSLLGIAASLLFVTAILLLVIGLRKYHVRLVIAVLIVYALLPNIFITSYQHTFASGIHAISYTGDGNCQFDIIDEQLLNGECSIQLHNRSNQDVSFEMQFLDSYFHVKNEEQITSLMNLAGPYNMTIEANSKQTIHLKELLDVSEVPIEFDCAASTDVHVKLIQGNESRSL